ncbi:MAG: ethanolamine utilization protein EutH, partial [Clostridium baratii]|nr:ethanolamine utilization protein EutH [Clostridium baratii]
MENLILYSISIFFLIGAIDYIIGNKLKLGKYFEDGIKT